MDTSGTVRSFPLLDSAEKNGIEKIEELLHRMGYGPMLQDFTLEEALTSSRTRPPSQDYQNTRKDTMSRWIVAEKAVQHAIKQSPSISTIFHNAGISKHQYCVQAGFDESLITSGVCYLEQIHIFVSTDAEIASTLLSDLGRSCSPFSSILFTDGRYHRIPTFNEDGSECEFDKLIYFSFTRMVGQGTSALPLNGIGCSPSADANGSGSSFSFQQNHRSGDIQKEHNKSRNNGKERETRGNDDNDNGAGNDPSQPETSTDKPAPAGNTIRKTEVSFEASSIINPPLHSERTFQSISVQGLFTVKTTPPTLNPLRSSERHVSFSELTFGTEIHNEIAYKQLYARVAIDSKQKNAHVSEAYPKRTPQYDSEETVTSSSTTGRASGVKAGFTLGPGAQGFILGNTRSANEECVSVERVQPRSAVSEQHHDGNVWWGFHVKDAKLQSEGLDIHKDILPRVQFKYFADNVELKDPPEDIDILITSLWSMIPPKKPNSSWIQGLLDRFKSGQHDQTCHFSNLFHIVAITPTLDSSTETRSHYTTSLNVDPYIDTSIEVERFATDEKAKLVSRIVKDSKKRELVNLLRAVSLGV